MCRRVDCPGCGKPTFAGCGMHVEQVLGGVPHDERCRCSEEQKEKAHAQEGGLSASVFRKILGGG